MPQSQPLNQTTSKKKKKKKNLPTYHPSIQMFFSTPPPPQGCVWKCLPGNGQRVRICAFCLGVLL